MMGLGGVCTRTFADVDPGLGRLPLGGGGRRAVRACGAQIWEHDVDRVPGTSGGGIEHDLVTFTRTKKGRGEKTNEYAQNQAQVKNLF